MSSSVPIFSLLRLSLGTSTCLGGLSALTKVDWEVLVNLSFEQGVAAIAIDGLQKAYEANPKLELAIDNPELEDLRYEWFGFCMTVEEDYKSHISALEKLAKFYKVQQIPMMLLKGYGLSLNYPVPTHRPSGDIDVYLWHLWNFADQMVSKHLRINVDNSHHHHSVFQFEGCTVENHYDFVNVHSHSSNKGIEATFKKLAEDRSKAVEHHLPDGTLIYLPSPDLNALFVARHMAAHFAAEHINLRQLLDWALFVDKHHTEVDWDLFWSQARKMGMEQFVLCINAIAVEQLGFESSIFHTPTEFEGFAVREHSQVERVLDDILSPVDNDSKSKGTIHYIWSRLKNWWRNRWKHRLVYSDSLLSTFFVQIRSHLMKPASIVGK